MHIFGFFRRVGQNSRGITLIEVMIATALLGAIALGIGSLMRESAVGLKRNKTVSIRRRLIDQYHDIARGGPSIQNTVNANAQLAAHIAGTPPPGGITNMGVNPPTPLYNIELRDGGNNIVVPNTGLFLNQNGGLCNPACDATNGYWIVQSTFAAKAGSEFEIITTVQQNPRLFIANDPMFDAEEQRLKTELSTSSAGTAALAQWVRNGTRIENINSGQVRILTSLRSMGNARVDGATVLDGNTRVNANLIVDNQLQVNDTTTLNRATTINAVLRVTGATNLQNVSTGNINTTTGAAVGNIVTQEITARDVSARDVSGRRFIATRGIQLGNDSTTCDAAAAGLVRYRPASGNLQYCDGTAYRNLSQPATINFTRQECNILTGSGGNRVRTCDFGVWSVCFLVRVRIMESDDVDGLDCSLQYAPATGRWQARIEAEDFDSARCESFCYNL